MVSRVFVVGMGMGNPATLTGEARAALDASGLIIGSARLVEALGKRAARTVCLVAPAAIAEELRAATEDVASVVMSGDVGFYSGATGLYEHLQGMDVRAIPGISSLTYLCARLRVPWQDVCVVSAHGRDQNLVGAVQTHRRTFVLAGTGASSASALCARLAGRGLGDVRVTVAERLSYPDERIVAGTAAELAGEEFASLSVLLVENDRPIEVPTAAPSLADDAFVRGDVPMTKEEVRALAIAKLRIRRADVVWDVGAGTGSVSVEAARAAAEGQVLAIERRPEALGLLERNKARFGLSNLRIVAGEAPEALACLPAPNRVFVGGSSGRLAEILAAAVEANPAVGLCLAAITLETLSACLGCIERLGLRDVDIVQVSVAKARAVGGRHLMMGGNPIYLVSADGPSLPQGSWGSHP